MPDISRNVDHSAVRIAEENPGMWQDYYREFVPFSRICEYKNDFFSYVAADWTQTEVDAGSGNTSEIILDARNGVLQLLSAGNEDDGVQIQLGGTSDVTTSSEAFAPAAGKNLWFETSIYLDDVTQSDFFVGLHVADTAIIASKGSGYIGFRSDDGDALLDFESCGASGASSDVGIHTLVDATAVKLGFKVTGLDKVEYYVNGVRKGAIQNPTNIPTELLRLSLAYLTGEAAVQYLAIDYVVVAQDR